MRKYLVTIGLILFSFTALAIPPFIPVGANIKNEAGHCPIGPFGRDGYVGIYKKYCHKLMPSEICTAYFVGIITNDNNKIDLAKVSFCKNILVQ